MEIVTTKDIFGAMCKHISKVSKYKLTDSDLGEPVTRPCFRIFMDTVNMGLYSSKLRQVKVSFDIYFYAKDREHSKAEIMEVEDLISQSFLEPFKIKDGCVVYIDEVEFEKLKNGILNCTLEFEIATEFKDETDVETMKELYLKEEKIYGNKTYN